MLCIYSDHYVLDSGDYNIDLYTNKGKNQAILKHVLVRIQKSSKPTFFWSSAICFQYKKYNNTKKMQIYPPTVKSLDGVTVTQHI